MSHKLGLDAKLFRNTGTYAAPVWVEIKNVKDVTLNLEAGEADVSTRGNAGWKATAATLKDGSIEFEMVWDSEEDDFAQPYFHLHRSGDAEDAAGTGGRVGSRAVRRHASSHAGHRSRLGQAARGGRIVPSQSCGGGIGQERVLQGLGASGLKLRAILAKPKPFRPGPWERGSRGHRSDRTIRCFPS